MCWTRRVGWFSLGAVLLACSAAAAGGTPAKPRIVTSLLPLYCFTRNIVGDAALVENLLAPGAGAHDFQFSPRERRLLDQADLIVVNGLGMEPWLTDALRKSTPSGRIVEAAAGVVESGAGGTRPNPHLWLDPILALRMLTNILAGVQLVDPSGREIYARNAEAYANRLRALDAELQAQLAVCRGASLVTQHDAFAWFARRYGLKITGVIEEVPDIAPSPRHLSELTRAIRDSHAKAIFVEPRHAAKLARQLAHDLELPVATLDTLETGSSTTDAYEQGMRSNARVLLQYLK